jgi:hypothetical protein
MTFCFINIFFLHSWFYRQNVNESSIRYKSSQQDLNRQKEKTLKGCKTNNKIQTNKNIERVQDKQQDTNRQKKKNDFKIEFDL